MCTVDHINVAMNSFANLCINNHSANRNDAETITSTKQIKFVANTSATEHLVKSHLVLTDFKHSENDFVQSANRNSLADLKIDGYGNLVL